MHGARAVGLAAGKNTLKHQLANEARDGKRQIARLSLSLPLCLCLCLCLWLWLRLSVCLSVERLRQPDFSRCDGEIVTALAAAVARDPALLMGRRRVLAGACWPDGSVAC